MSGHLTDVEWIFLTQLIYRLNMINDAKQFQTVCIENLQVLIPYQKAFFTRATRQGGIIRYDLPSIINGPGPSVEDKKFVGGGYDNFANVFLYLRQSKVIRNSDILTDDELEKTPLYKEIYLPQNTYYGMKLGLIHEDALIGYIGMLRTKDHGDFSDRDMFILDVLKDHLSSKFCQLLKTMQDCGQISRRNSKDYGLTSREIEVVCLLEEGKACAEICEALFISESTLSKHIHHIYNKVGVKNRVQLLHSLEK